MSLCVRVCVSYDGEHVGGCGTVKLESEVLALMPGVELVELAQGVCNGRHLEGG